MTQRFGSVMQKLGRVPSACWVALLTLPALAPLAHPGFLVSDDGLIHAFRLAALDRAVRAGVLYPRWFPEFGFGYGQPVFNFYGPLTTYTGLPGTLLGISPEAALELVFAAGVLASGLAMYLFARSHLERGPAIVAATVYVYLPYHLVDLYVRGALAELWAFAWFPLVLWAFSRLVNSVRKERVYWVALAGLVLCALVTTHSLSTLVFAPVLVAYVAFLLLQGAGARQVREAGVALAVFLAAVVAIGVSAFHWLPILVESQYVGLGHGTSQGYLDHLLSLADLVSLRFVYPFLGEQSGPRTFPIGLVQAAIIAAGIVLALRYRRLRSFSAFFLVVALVSTFMLTTASAPIWKALEGGLAFLQYPWRFQALAVLATALICGVLVQQLTRAGSPGRLLLGAFLIVATGLSALLGIPADRAVPEMSVEAMWQRDRDTGQVGATWTGEYLPVWVEEQRWAISLSDAEPGGGDNGLSPGRIALASVAYTGYELKTGESPSIPLILHQFHFPGWQAEWQSGLAASRPAGRLALAAFDLPASSRIRARLALTRNQMWGTTISVAISLVCTVGMLVWLRRRRSTNKEVASRRRWTWRTLLLMACYTLIALVLISSLVLPNGRFQSVAQTRVNFEDKIELLGYRLTQTEFAPGEDLVVNLYWLALQEPGSDYKAFVHLTDADMTRQPAQHDGDPGGGFSPTSRWMAGEIVPDRHTLSLPDSLTPGRYLLWAGIYDFETVKNLAVISSVAPVQDGRVLLGEIEVEAR